MSERVYGEREIAELTERMERQELVLKFNGWGAVIEQRNHPYKFRVRVGITEGMKYPFVQVQMWRPDIFTGVYGWGGGGKSYVGPHCTRSEFNQMVLGMSLAMIEHEWREGFYVDGERPFHPHISTEALIEASHMTDARKTPTSEANAL